MGMNTVAVAVFDDSSVMNVMMVVKATMIAKDDALPSAASRLLPMYCDSPDSCKECPGMRPRSALRAKEYAP